MELKDLIGKHILDTAAIMTVKKAGPDEYAEDADVVSFGMDGKTFTAVEDPSDGYRSYLGEIKVEDGHTEALRGAAPIGRAVVITHAEQMTDGHYQGECDIITVIDVETGHVWMRLGTDNTDDYYPGCVMYWAALETEQGATS